MSTPMILPVVFTFSIRVPPIVCSPTVVVDPSTTISVFSIVVSSSLMKFPSITSPTAPSPPPPKNSILGNPQSKIFPVLHVGVYGSPFSSTRSTPSQFLIFLSILPISPVPSSFDNLFDILSKTLAILLFLRDSEVDDFDPT